MKFRTIAGAILAGLIATLLIAGVGALLGPTWEPRSFESTLVIESADTAIGGAIETAPPGTYEFSSRVEALEVAEGVSERVQIRTPIGAGSELPAVVFLHGAGTADYLGFSQQAEDLASAGIVTVVADKRLDNYSVQSRDYVISADDYYAGVALAASLPEVDPARVGIYGESEGAYIAPVLAVNYPDDVNFVVLVSAPVVPPRSQGAYASHTYLTATGVPQDVFRLIPRALGAQIPLGWLNYVDFDPAPYQQRMTQPTLVVYGTADNSMPQAQGAAQIIDDLAVAQNDAVTVRFYEGANHGIRIGDGSGPLADNFSRDLARWVNGLPETGSAAPQVAGATPNQVVWADPPRPAPAILSGNLLLVAHLLWPVMLLFSAGAGIVLLGRVRRNGDSVAANMRLPVLLGLAAALALIAWYVWVSYVRDIGALAMSYQQNPDVTFGGYRAENAVALAAAFVLGFAIYHWFVRYRAGERLSTLGRVSAYSAAIATTGLLVLASYWSGFPTFGWGT